MDEDGNGVVAKGRVSATEQTISPVVGKHHQHGGTPVDEDSTAPEGKGC